MFNVDVDVGSAGGFPVINGTCGTIQLNSGVFAGGSIGLFGKKLSKADLPLLPKLLDGKLIVGKVSPVQRMGKGTGCKKM